MVLRQADGPLDPARAVRLATQIASGLAAAHAVEVLHRDLKPANVLLAHAGTPAEQAKLIDFGIAKSLQRTAVATSMLVGTPQYMAPEQLTPQPQDGRLDLWQLGAVLFEMLTGRTPYADAADAPALAEAFGRHVDGGPRPSDRVATLRAYPALDGLVSRLLASDPARRPRTAGVVCHELARIEHQLAPGPGHNPLALLEALAATPGADAWWALCRYLLDQAEGRQADLVDAAEPLIAHWPDDHRPAPVAWWDACVAGDARPLWRLARSLDLSGRGLDDRDVADLAQAPALATLTRLHLSHNAITVEGARALAASPYLGGLVSLDLAHNRLGSAGVAALAGGGALPRLECLDLSANGVGAEGAEALARAPWRLRVLRLGDNDIGAAGTGSLVASPALRRLQVLDLANNALGSDGVAALATARELPALVDLDLAGNAIGPGGAAALAVSPALASVHALRLGRNRLGPAGAELLASLRVPALETLDLSGNELGATGAMLLTASPIVRRLKSLDVSDNQLGDAGLAALLGAPGLAGLRHLATARNGLTDAGVSLVGTSPLELTRLDVAGNDIGDAGAGRLGAALARTRVSHLGAADAGLTGEGVSALIERAGGRLAGLDVGGANLALDAGPPFTERPEAQALVELDLTGCRLDPAGLGRLAHAHRLSGLRRLRLSSNRLTDEDGVAVVAALERFPALSEVALADNALGRASLQTMAGSSLAARLQRLDLAHNAIDDGAVAAVARGTWPALQWLGLAGNTISQAGAAALASAPGLPLLASLDLRRNVLKGGIDLHSLPRATVARLEAGFAIVAAKGADFAARFYAELFARVSMRHQQQHLMAALAMVIDHLRTPDQVVPLLEALARRHVGYRVQASHYVALTHVLVDVLRDSIGEAWTTEQEEAWHRALDAVCAVMLTAHQRTISAGPG